MESVLKSLSDHFSAVIPEEWRPAYGLSRVADNGLIKVDKHLKTTAENIWAIGDVAEKQQFTYISLDSFRIIKSSITDNGSYNLDKRKNVPYSM